MDTSSTPAADLLRAFLTDPEHPERSQAWLAKTLDIAQPSVSGWLTGKSRPEDAHREALEILTGIDRTAWRRPAEHEVVERARRAKNTPVPGTLDAVSVAPPPPAPPAPPPADDALARNKALVVAAMLARKAERDAAEAARRGAA